MQREDRRKQNAAAYTGDGSQQSCEEAKQHQERT
jgi:hypothetical protein